MILFKHTHICPDCGVNAWNKGEDFYVTDRIWKSTIPNHMRDDVFCIGCFESRLGRKLQKRDFKAWFHTNRWWGDKTRKVNERPSDRLKERLKLSRKSRTPALTFYRR